MSKARKLRHVRRWARYFNHYGHIPSVIIGGQAACRTIWSFNPSWSCIRRQQKHRFAHSYPMIGDD